jgi:lysophospholipase L1-like esterase/frataxin-like iron-binding protein CyaY
MDNYTDLTITELINKIKNSRYWGLPTMLGELLPRLTQGIPTDAPSDGNQYARKDGEWVEVESSEAGVESITGNFVDNTDPLNPVIVDAPSDGKQYAQKDGVWTEVEADSNLPIEVTVDGNIITRDSAGNIAHIILENGKTMLTLEETTLYKLKSDLDLQNKILNLNVSILGDSISTDNGGGVGISEVDTYGGLLRINEGCAIFRNSVAGTNLSTDFTVDLRVNSLNSQFEPNVILVFGGVNDFLEDATLGTFGDTTTATFYGGVDLLCKKLQTRYPNARIFFMTPLHHKYTTAGGLVPEYNGTNYMTEFVEAIEKVCKRYGISVINTNQDSGITCYNINTIAPNDLIHVNEIGHQMIYNTIISETNKKL